MPVKNCAKYLEEAILSYIDHGRDDIILVIIDDGSSDTSPEICKKLAEMLPTKILFKKNHGLGKVMGINYGFSLVDANYYKFVDGDDVLLPNFWTFFLKCESQKISFVHPFNIVDSSLNLLGILPMAVQNISNNIKYIEQLILLPKVAWTFKASDITGMFPMPENLPFEDIWFSLFSYTKNLNIYNVDKPLYNYRQHGSQTYGNISDISSERLNFRYSRIIDAIHIIEKQNAFADYLAPLECAKSLANFMIRQESFKDIFFKCGILSATKHLLLRDFKKCYQFVRFVVWRLRSLQSLIASKS